MTAAKKAAEAPKDVPDAGSRLPAGGADNQVSASPRPAPAKKAAPAVRKPKKLPWVARAHRARGVK